MVLDIDSFKSYINVFDSNDTLTEIYLSAAEDIVSEYLNKELSTFTTIPGLIQITVFRIGALLSSESSGNIGVTSKSFADGSRTFVKTTDFTQYLSQISRWRVIDSA